MSLVLASGFGEAFNTPEAKIYFEDFIKWAKSQKESPIPSGSVVVRCENCKEEFELTLEEWADDDKICDCGGKLIEVKEEAQIEGEANGKLL